MLLPDHSSCHSLSWCFILFFCFFDLLSCHSPQWCSKKFKTRKKSNTMQRETYCCLISQVATLSFSLQRCSVITHFSDELLACDFSAQICSFMILAGYSNKGGFTCTSTLLLTLSNHSIRPFNGFNSFHFDLSREPECRVALKGQVVKKYEIPLC